MAIQLAFTWYEQLLNDCQTLIREAQRYILYKHWQLGQRILQDELKFEKPEYGSRTIANLAEDLGVSETTLYYEIQFARKYPEFSNALENLPWREVIKLLPFHNIPMRLFLVDYAEDKPQRKLDL